MVALQPSQSYEEFVMRIDGRIMGVDRKERIDAPHERPVGGRTAPRRMAQVSPTGGVSQEGGTSGSNPHT